MHGPASPRLTLHLSDAPLPPPRKQPSRSSIGRARSSVVSPRAPARVHPLQDAATGSALLAVLSPLGRPRTLPVLLASHPPLARAYAALALVALRVPSRLRGAILSAAAAEPLPPSAASLSPRDLTAVQLVVAVRAEKAPPANLRDRFADALRPGKVHYAAAVAALGALDAAVASLVAPARAAAMYSLRLPRIHASPDADLLHRAAAPLRAAAAGHRARSAAARWMAGIPSTHSGLIRHANRRLGFAPGYLSTGPVAPRRAIALAVEELLLASSPSVPNRLKHLMCLVRARAAGSAQLAAHAAFLAHRAGATLFQLLLASDRRTLLVMRDRYRAAAPPSPRGSSVSSADGRGPRKRPRARGVLRERYRGEPGDLPPRPVWRPADKEDGVEEESLSEEPFDDASESGLDDDGSDASIDDNAEGYYDDDAEEDSAYYDGRVSAGEFSSTLPGTYSSDVSAPLADPFADDLAGADYTGAPDHGLGDASLYVVEPDADGQSVLRLTDVVFSEREVALLLFAHAALTDGVPRAGAAEAAEMRRLFPARAAVEAAGVVAFHAMLEQWTGVRAAGPAALEAPVRRFVQGPVGAKLKLADVGQRAPSKKGGGRGDRKRPTRASLPAGGNNDDLQLFELYRMALVQPLRYEDA